MDSRSLDTPQPNIFSRDERGEGNASQVVETKDRAARTGTVLIASLGDPVAADYATYLGQQSRSAAVVVADDRVRRLVEPPSRTVAIDAFLRSAPATEREVGPMDSLVLFVGRRLTAPERRDLDDMIAIARQRQPRLVAIVSTFRVHLDDQEATEVENDIVSRMASHGDRVVVFRPGHVLGRHSHLSGQLERLSPLYPLVPRRLSSCFLEGEELFAAIEFERLKATERPGGAERWQSAEGGSNPPFRGRPVGVKNRVYTILGPNRSWREMLFRHRTAGPASSLHDGGQHALVVAPCRPGACVCSHAPGPVVALVTAVERADATASFAGRTARACHRHNIDHVKVVGYNNGVAHFGHRHPEKTIISTVRCHRMAFAGPQMLKTDAGATIRMHSISSLNPTRELYVVPNYSYVSLGTSFFVPIHGSAVDYSTVADTICRVVLYDPDSDRVVVAGRDDAAFQEHVYNQEVSPRAAAALYSREAKSRYFVHREVLENPSSGDLLAALHVSSATNVEIRQAHAASSRVTVSRYYTDLGNTTSPPSSCRAMRSGGWDRLEENPVTSYLMHALSRRVAWHTELFFTPPEFDVFWKTHGQLPLRKIQLRYLRRDGLPHSPCRDDDCVSADLFLFRRNRYQFFDYLKKTFHDRSNQSRQTSH